MHGVSADASGVYVIGDTEGTFPGQTRVGLIDAFLAKLVDDDDDKREKHVDDDDDKMKELMFMSESWQKHESVLSDILSIE